MNYKAGDKVVLKPDGLLVKDADESIPTGVNLGGFWWNYSNSEAIEGTDRVLEIEIVNEKEYHATASNGQAFNCITDEMILGYAFDWGEEIEVSDTGKKDDKWEQDTFISYVPGDKHAIICKNTLWKFARPICKSIITIKRRLYKDGVDVTDTISDESRKELLGE